MIRYINRKTKKEEEELVYGAKGLIFFYQGGFLGKLVCSFVSRIPLFSHFYGWLQKLPWSRHKIEPFIKKFKVDKDEFTTTEFASFNDFFIRTLKKEVRPLANSPFIIPADGRYLFYPTYDRFAVKGKIFCLHKLLLDSDMAEAFQGGSMVIARLCPSDYHRFHFPLDCIPGPARLINGPLFSVNPLALKYNISILAENKRVITSLSSDYGRVLFIEVGATNVGSIHQTYTPYHKASKGQEKGFFSFGGSSLILLFEPGCILFDQDLLETRGLEIYCQMGQSMGCSR